MAPWVLNHLGVCYEAYLANVIIIVMLQYKTNNNGIINEIKNFPSKHSRNEISRWDELDLIIDSMVSRHIKSHVSVSI